MSDGVASVTEMDSELASASVLDSELASGMGLDSALRVGVGLAVGSEKLESEKESESGMALELP